eukprot:COSAG01_NODE_16036_length_1275_cov_48.571429_2_plen_194_part_00
MPLLISVAPLPSVNTFLQHVAASSRCVHVTPAQSVLSLLESLTFGDGHELRLEHLALVGAALQHVDASAAVVHVVPAQSVLSLLESLTLPEPHELRLEHLALVGAALQHVDVSTLASHVAPAQSVLSLAVSFVNPLLHCCNFAHFWGVAVQQYDAHTDTGHPVFDLAGSGTLPGYCAQSAVVTIEQVAFTEVP